MMYAEFLDQLRRAAADCERAAEWSPEVYIYQGVLEKEVVGVRCDDGEAGEFRPAIVVDVR